VITRKSGDNIKFSGLPWGTNVIVTRDPKTKELQIQQQGEEQTEEVESEEADTEDTEKEGEDEE
jgi:hypothetical protein